MVFLKRFMVESPFYAPRPRTLNLISKKLFLALTAGIFHTAVL